MATLGRKPVLDDEKKRTAILAILAVGCTRQAAADFVGCAVSTIRRTASRDEEFAAALRRAEFGLEFAQLKNIQAAGQKHWQASAWMLERRFPETYGRRDPRLITAQQIGRLMAQFAEIVAAEIRNKTDRRKVLERLQALAADLERAADTKVKKEAPP